MKIRSITIGAIIAIGAIMWLALSCNKDGIEPNDGKERPSGVRNDETVMTNTYTTKLTKSEDKGNDETVLLDPK